MATSTPSHLARGIDYVTRLGEAPNGELHATVEGVVGELLDGVTFGSDADRDTLIARLGGFLKATGVLAAGMSRRAVEAHERAQEADRRAQEAAARARRQPRRRR